MITLWPHATDQAAERYEHAVEAIEDQHGGQFTRYTLAEVIRANTGCADYSAVNVVVNELRRFELIRCVSPDKVRPQIFETT